MSGPAEAIAALDEALADVGQLITLRRTTGTQQIPFDVQVKAMVRGYSPEELIGGITQQDSMVILSPTDIDAKGWPGPATAPTNEDRRVPRKNDKAIINGKLRNVEAGVGIYMADVLVRIEMRVLG